MTQPDFLAPWPPGSLGGPMADQPPPIAALKHVDLAFAFLGSYKAKSRQRLGWKVIQEPASGQPIIGLLVDVPDFNARPRAINRYVDGFDFQNIPLGHGPGGPDRRRINEKKAQAPGGAVDDPAIAHFFFLAFPNKNPDRVFAATEGPALSADETV
jgi:hypothetical protein